MLSLALLIPIPIHSATFETTPLPHALYLCELILLSSVVFSTINGAASYRTAGGPAEIVSVSAIALNFVGCLLYALGKVINLEASSPTANSSATRIPPV
jgi:hypothetical protein